MTTQRPAKSGGANLPAVDDEDADYSPVADKPKKPPEQGSVAEQVAKDNERIQKGAP
jgi:hypothetical protein